MPHDRAVLFDLDDTLYPLQRFVRSGFRAVANHLERTYGIDRRRTVAMLLAASEGPGRGREFQAVAGPLSIPTDIVPDLVAIVRGHRPLLRLPRGSARALERLRAGWRLAVVTNGVPEIQARKVRALGLAKRVDAVIFAHEHGTGAGKPEAAPFLAALAALGVGPDRAVFVGDDERCDVAGASSVGMRTVLYVSGRPRRAARRADAVVDTLLDVPSVAEALVPAGRREGIRHVA